MEFELTGLNSRLVKSPHPWGRCRQRRQRGGTGFLSFANPPLPALRIGICPIEARLVTRAGELTRICVPNSNAPNLGATQNRAPRSPMNTPIKTENAPAPFSNYSQAVETPAGTRILHVSGQVGNTVSGELSEDPAEQNKQAWRNIFAILEAAGMNKTNIIDVLAIVTDSAIPGFSKQRCIGIRV